MVSYRLGLMGAALLLSVGAAGAGSPLGMFRSDPIGFLELGTQHIKADPQAPPIIDINTPEHVPFPPGPWHAINLVKLGVPISAVAVRLRGRLQHSRTNLSRLMATYIDFCAREDLSECNVSAPGDSRNAYWKQLTPVTVNGGRADVMATVPVVNGTLIWRWVTQNWTADSDTKYGSILLWLDAYFMPAHTSSVSDEPAQQHP